MESEIKLELTAEQLSLGTQVVAQQPRIVVDWSSPPLCSIMFNPRDCDPYSTELMRVCRQLNTQPSRLFIVSDMHVESGLLIVRHNLAIDDSEEACGRFRETILLLAETAMRAVHVRNHSQENVHSTK